MASANVKNVMSIDPTGAYKRKASAFRNFISKQAPPAGEDAIHYPPAAGRYRLYYSYACPWACRVLAFLSAKGLTKAFDLVCVHPVFAVTMPEVDEDESWVFDTKGEHPGTRPDPLGNPSLRHVYVNALPNMGLPPNTDFNDTVPLLYDTKTNTIVNNESSEIIRMLNDDFNEFAEHPEVDLCPQNLRKAIDETNDWFYESVNNGVYKSGFATTQAAYNEATEVLYGRLDEIEARLSKQRYLIESTTRPTESDVRLFQTIVRFDDVYYVHFKCSKRAIREYPNITGWMRDVYQTLNLKDTVNFHHIRTHYFCSHPWINPYRIVPISCGVEETLVLPHGRANL